MNWTDAEKYSTTEPSSRTTAMLAAPVALLRGHDRLSSAVDAR